jgi:hypothetical protein
MKNNRDKAKNLLPYPGFSNYKKLIMFDTLLGDPEASGSTGQLYHKFKTGENL